MEILSAEKRTAEERKAEIAEFHFASQRSGSFLFDRRPKTG